MSFKRATEPQSIRARGVSRAHYCSSGSSADWSRSSLSLGGTCESLKNMGGAVARGLGVARDSKSRLRLLTGLKVGESTRGVPVPFPPA